MGNFNTGESGVTGPALEPFEPNPAEYFEAFFAS
jgi:hypothetical protein